MRKLAHYFYSDGNELVVFGHKGLIHIYDEKGEFPKSPVTNKRTPHPGHETHEQDWSFDALGLYYGYEMADTNWDFGD